MVEHKRGGVWTFQRWFDTFRDEMRRCRDRKGPLHLFLYCQKGRGRSVAMALVVLHLLQHDSADIRLASSTCAGRCGGTIWHATLPRGRRSAAADVRSARTAGESSRAISSLRPPVKSLRMASRDR